MSLKLTLKYVNRSQSKCVNLRLPGPASCLFSAAVKSALCGEGHAGAAALLVIQILSDLGHLAGAKSQKNLASKQICLDGPPYMPACRTLQGNSRGYGCQMVSAWMLAGPKCYHCRPENDD